MHAQPEYIVQSAQWRALLELTAVSLVNELFLGRLCKNNEPLFAESYFLFY